MIPWQIIFFSFHSPPTLAPLPLSSPSYCLSSYIPTTAVSALSTFVQLSFSLPLSLSLHLLVWSVSFERPATLTYLALSPHANAIPLRLSYVHSFRIESLVAFKNYTKYSNKKKMKCHFHFYACLRLCVCASRSLFPWNKNTSVSLSSSG